MKLKQLATLLSASAILAACGGSDEATTAATPESGDMPDMSVSDADLAANPFRQAWDTPFGVPPFEAIDDADFMPAFKQGVVELRAEIDAIVSNPEAANF
ncbi:MAG: M3 family peptidase, partial [Pseudomonadota bacterium]